MIKSEKLRYPCRLVSAIAHTLFWYRSKQIDTLVRKKERKKKIK